MNRLFENFQIYCDVRKQDGRPCVGYFQFLNLIFFKPYLYLSKSILLPTMATGSSFPTAFIYWVMFSRYFRTVWKLSRFVILYTTMKASAQRKYRWGSLSSCKCACSVNNSSKTFLNSSNKVCHSSKRVHLTSSRNKETGLWQQRFQLLFFTAAGGDLGTNRNNTQGVH